MGTLSNPANIEGKLSNATLRGMAVELRISGTILQWKYEDEDNDDWRDLIDLVKDYNDLTNLPTVNGTEIKGEMGGYIMTTDDELSNAEVTEILNG